MRLIITDENKHSIHKDQNLIDHLSQAYQWLTLITSGKVQSIKEIAEAEQIDQSHITRMINKAFLAPEIIRAILNGTQPPHLTLKYLKQFRALPNDWSTQKSLLGFNQ
jgi:site-specific DNA recombinase